MMHGNGLSCLRSRASAVTLLAQILSQRPVRKLLAAGNVLAFRRQAVGNQCRMRFVSAGENLTAIFFEACSGTKPPACATCCTTGISRRRLADTGCPAHQVGCPRLVPQGLLRGLEMDLIREGLRGFRKQGRATSCASMSESMPPSTPKSETAPEFRVTGSREGDPVALKAASRVYLFGSDGPDLWLPLSPDCSNPFRAELLRLLCRL